ncbi:glycosyltransferase family 4 protein [candidate division KSB1 bacterium]|nr:glycosyltransferase family 4 protein [candidate division KSB1 bacterium]
MRIVITTTLNDNLFHAKLIPLLRGRPEVELVVVTDRPGPAYERVRWVWPRGVSRLFGRLGSRILLLVGQVWHPRTKLVMAYNVVPHGLFAMAVARWRGIPVYLHLIGGQGELDFVDDRLASDNRMVARSRNPARLQALARRTVLRAARVFVPGHNTERFVQGLGFPAARIVRLHSAIDPARYFPGDAPRDIDVLVSAQLRERKRPLFTLEVFRAILDRRPGTRFCWLGDGPLHDEFAAGLKRLDLEQSVTWSSGSEVADYYRRSKVCLLCSVSEGLSLACMEAMACGAVPVAADCGDMSDIVGASGAGSLLPVATFPAEYATAVIEYLESEELWKAHSRRAEQCIINEHSFTRATAGWREILSQPLA